MTEEVSHTEAASFTGGNDLATSGGGTDYAAPISKEIADKAFEVIASSPDIDVDDYVQEQKDRAAEEAGEELPPNRKRERRERFQRAPEAARDAESKPTRDTRDALERQRDENDPRHEPKIEAREETEAEHHERESRQRERDARIAETAVYHARAEAFKQAVSDYQEWVEGTFGVFPPQESVAAALLASPVGPELAYRLSQDIDAIEQLNALPPAEAARRIARAEGMLIAMHENQKAPPLRSKATKAPKPIAPVRGGAGPAVDASKSDDMDRFAGWLQKDLAKRRGR
jgi:hypothetical protein